MEQGLPHHRVICHRHSKVEVWVGSGTNWQASVPQYTWLKNSTKYTVLTRGRPENEVCRVFDVRALVYMPRGILSTASSGMSSMVRNK